MASKRVAERYSSGLTQERSGRCFRFRRHLARAYIGKLPDFHRTVPTSGSQPLAGGTKGHSIDLLLMFRQRDAMRGQRVAAERRGVPNPDRLIVARGGQPMAVRTERHAGDEAGVGINGERLKPRGSIQEPNGPIKTSHGD